MAVSCAAVAVVASFPAPADVVHLKRGGQLEGKVVDSQGDTIRIRTVTAEVSIPREAVDRIEESPALIEQYDRRLADTPPTPEGQFALANWCDEQGMTGERRAHLERAVELNPDYSPARHALGFVQVGPLWVDANLKAQHAAGGAGDIEEGEDAPTPDEMAALIAEIQRDWSRRIRAIRSHMLDSSLDRQVEEGRQRIHEIHDPLAILPLVRTLSDGKRPAREALVEALSAFPHDEATMNLAALALSDSDGGVRARALSQLARRNDPRITPILRKALRSDSDALIRRAAVALGVLADASAVPDLIDSLRAQRRRVVEVPADQYLGHVQEAFNTPTQITLGRTRVARVYPHIGVAAASSYVFGPTSYERRTVTVFRTEVLEALKQITGENFGFDEAAWRRWHEEQRP
jgi:hypothetical protein